MSIDLGDAPVGTSPTEAEKAQIRSSISAIGDPVDVANNAAKLALTGIEPGYMARITGEADRLEMYMRDSGYDPNKLQSVTVYNAQANGSSFDGTYIKTTWAEAAAEVGNGLNTPGGVTDVTNGNGNGAVDSPILTAQINGNWCLMLVTSTGKWCLADWFFAGYMQFVSNEDAATTSPEDCTWVLADLGEILPVVTGQLIDGSIDSEWDIVGPNTFELYIADLFMSSNGVGPTVNGVALSGASTTYIGWVRAGQKLPIDPNGSAPYQDAYFPSRPGSASGMGTNGVFYPISGDRSPTMDCSMFYSGDGSGYDSGTGGYIWLHENPPIPPRSSVTFTMSFSW